MPLALLLFVLFWMLLIGGVIGSFLNVVIYRLPAGLNLSFPPSHCPKCKHPIRAYDNVPVLGWLWLRGKCRDCHAPISARYPTIEAVCALLFAGLGLVILRDCPVAELGSQIVLVAFDFMLVSTLLAAGMIEYDGQKVPAKLFVPAILVALIFSWNIPPLHPVPYFYPEGTIFAKPGNWHEIWGGGIDAILGACVAVAAITLTPLLSQKQRTGFFAAVITVGLYLGWQIVLTAILVSLPCFSLGRVFRFKICPTLWLLVLILVLIAWVKFLWILPVS